MSQESVTCPFPSCHVSGRLRRILTHVREVHNSDDVSEAFVSRWKLRRCEHCQKWFMKLGQHISQCRRASLLDNSSQGQATGTFSIASILPPSQPPPFSPCQENVTAEERKVTPPTLNVPSVDEDLNLINDKEENRELSAWQFIRDLSISDILQTHPPRMVQTIKPASKTLFQECCLVALRKIRQDPADEAAWKLFFLLPRMLLRPMSRGGRTNSKEVKSLFNNFLEFRWKSLVHLKENNCRKARHDSASESRRAALQLVRCGELPEQPKS